MNKYAARTLHARPPAHPNLCPGPFSLSPLSHDDEASGSPCAGPWLCWLMLPWRRPAGQGSSHCGGDLMEWQGRNRRARGNGVEAVLSEKARRRPARRQWRCARRRRGRPPRSRRSRRRSEVASPRCTERSARRRRIRGEARTGTASTLCRAYRAVAYKWADLSDECAWLHEGQPFTNMRAMVPAGEHARKSVCGATTHSAEFALARKHTFALALTHARLRLAHARGDIGGQSAASDVLTPRFFGRSVSDRVGAGAQQARATRRSY